MIGFPPINAARARKARLWHKRDRFEHFPLAEQPRLLIDVSEIIRHDAHTGIQRVVRAVWSELDRRSGTGFVVQPVFATKTRGYCSAPLDFLRARRVYRRNPVSVRPGDKFLGLDLSAHLLPHHRQQLLGWKSQGVGVHVIVYDLLPLLQPEWFTGATVSNFGKWFEVVQNVADQAICISDEVAQTLHQRLAGENTGPHIVRLKMGADIAASVPSTGISPHVMRLLHRLQFRSAILMVGTIEPRKGYDTALAAFEFLWRTRPADAPDLVIVGRPGWNTSRLQATLREHVESGVRLHWLAGVSDEALCQLYRRCAGVLVASRAEGFGLPVVEAAHFRRYVLARDLPVFREQQLPNALFFRDDDPSSLGARLMQLVKLGDAPIPTVALPRWTDSVADLLSVMGLAHQRMVEPDPLLRTAS